MTTVPFTLSGPHAWLKVTRKIKIFRLVNTKEGKKNENGKKKEGEGEKNEKKKACPV